MEEYTYKWESLTTRVLELIDDQWLQTYVWDKPYIKYELELHNILTLDKA